MMTIPKKAAAVALMALCGWAPLVAGEEDATAVDEQGAGCEGGPAGVVTQFLGLTPDQLPVLEQALHERQQALVPILQGIATREQRIRELIASGGSAAEIGVLVVQVHQLRQHAENAQASFLARIENLLDAEQRVRWQQVRAAARLQPVVPAFQALQML
jgi:Spy/CpxP family protein refolding chaperone